MTGQDHCPVWSKYLGIGFTKLFKRIKNKQLWRILSLNVILRKWSSALTASFTFKIKKRSLLLYLFDLFGVLLLVPNMNSIKDSQETRQMYYIELLGSINSSYKKSDNLEKKILAIEMLIVTFQLPVRLTESLQKCLDFSFYIKMIYWYWWILNNYVFC